ncbi:MAG: cation:proton antiporter [Thermodesulfobacteriota bacterium]
MDHSLLRDILVVFSLSIGVILACHAIRVPPVVGFLLTGVLAGPTGLGLVSGVAQVELMAEVGVILLLFTIGLEFSLAELTRLRRTVLTAGGLQVSLTIAAVWGLSLLAGLDQGQAVFLGFLAALSSTAIVLALYQERLEIEAPHGRVGLSVLILQDLLIVPMVLLVPFLAGRAGNLGPALGLLALKAAGVAALLFVVARKLVPVALRLVLRTRSRELFLLAVLAICLAVGFLTSAMGLSLSLGAFLAGMVVADSEYSHHAMEGILPFKDVFTSLFFVSIGMLLDVGFVLQHPQVVAAAFLVILLLKLLAAGAATLAAGYPLRTAVLAGLGLCQVGEFSFVLARAGLGEGLIGQDLYQLFLSASIMTMAATPFLIQLAPRASEYVAGRLLRQPPPRPVENGGPAGLSDHLVIVGFGFGGRRLARAASAAAIPHLVLETNPDTVRAERAAGVPIRFGDARHPAALEHAGIARARILAVVINDPVAVRRVTQLARAANPALYIVVRTRFASEIGPLADLGADDVIPEEFETAVEIFTRVMHRYLTPRDEIERMVADVRAEGYGMLRSPSLAAGSLADVRRSVPGLEVCALRLAPGSPLDGASLSQAALRREHGLTVLAVSRAGQAVPNPGAEFVLAQGDVVYVLGCPGNIAAQAGLFGPKAEEDA